MNDSEIVSDNICFRKSIGKNNQACIEYQITWKINIIEVRNGDCMSFKNMFNIDINVYIIKLLYSIYIIYV